jgi:hypothetical protein
MDPLSVDHARPRHPRRGLRHIDTALGHRHYALVFLEPRTRRLHITDVTAHPTQAWTAQQARNLTASMDSLRLMLRDHDGKYSAAFDEVFRADGTDILTTAPRAPRTNAHPRERVIKTPPSEVRDHLLIVNEAHTRHVRATSLPNTSGTTKHTGPTKPDSSDHPTYSDQPIEPVARVLAKLLHTRVLRGVINEYRYAA